MLLNLRIKQNFKTLWNLCQVNQLRKEFTEERKVLLHLVPPSGLLWGPPRKKLRFRLSPRGIWWGCSALCAETPKDLSSCRPLQNQGEYSIPKSAWKSYGLTDRQMKQILQGREGSWKILCLTMVITFKFSRKKRHFHTRLSLQSSAPYKNHPRENFLFPFFLLKIKNSLSGFTGASYCI